MATINKRFGYSPPDCYCKKYRRARHKLPYGDVQKQCTCTMSMVNNYQDRISGPILDPIDIHLEVQRVPMDKLADLDRREPADGVRRRFEAARHASRTSCAAAQTAFVRQRRHGAE